MSVETAETIVSIVAAYLALGITFAMAFVARGVTSIDPGARGMPWAARLLIVPGAAALWPLMLWKWLTQKAPPIS